MNAGLVRGRRNPANARLLSAWCGSASSGDAGGIARHFGTLQAEYRLLPIVAASAQAAKPTRSVIELVGQPDAGAARLIGGGGTGC
jgi:hypothetical protein